MAGKKPQKWHKLYEGVRCVLSIIPAKIRKEANLKAGDYVAFSYDYDLDILVLKIKRN